MPRALPMRGRHRRQHHGIAVVEFAICLPVIILIILGFIEACNLIFLKQALTEASYQGALAAMKPEATETEVETRIQSILDARSISSATIVVADGHLHQVDAGDEFTVEVSATTAPNRISPTIISGLNLIQSTCTAIKQ